MLIPIAVAIVACLFLAGGYLPPLTKPTTYEPSPDDDTCTLGEQPTFELANFRAYFGSEPGAFVLGWPSTGGLYTFTAKDGVELDFLQLNRFNSTPRPSRDPADEDTHCYRMRKLGASWFKRRRDYYSGDLLLGYPSPQKPVLIVGWPATGGVWILKTIRSKSGDIGAGMVHNAFNMDERCDAIMQLGGTFYSNPKDCPDLDLN